MADVLARMALEIGANTKQFASGIKGVESQLNSFASFAKKAGAAIGGIFAINKLRQFSAENLDLYEKQVRAETLVSQAVKSTGMAAGFTAPQLFKMASGLQAITRFGDEEILQKVTGQLLTFTNIGGQQFERTQKAAIDLATVLNTDLQSATIQLGKALNDPVANLSALSRSGIQFSKEQKVMIKGLAEQNRLSEAQTIILDELERQYGGQAEALAKVGRGPLQMLINKWGDYREILGEKLMPVMNQFAAIGMRMVDTLLPKESEKLTELTTALNAEFNALKTGNVQGEARAQLIGEINKKYGEYLPSLVSEKTTLTELNTLQEKANQILLEKIAIAAKQEILQEAMNKLTSLQKTLTEETIELERMKADQADKYTATLHGMATTGEAHAMATQNQADRVEYLKNKLTEATTNFMNLKASIGDINTTMTGTADGSGTGGTVGAFTAVTDKLKEAMAYLADQGSTDAADFIDNFTIGEVPQTIDKVVYGLENMALMMSDATDASGMMRAENEKTFKTNAKSAEKFGDKLKSIQAQSISGFIREGVAAAISSALKGLPFPANIIAGGIAFAGANALFAKLPSFRQGTQYVPNDTLAFLHRGETVKNAFETSREGGRGLTMDFPLRRMVIAIDDERNRMYNESGYIG